jgi:sugar phosphate isomerase/epimerase
MAKGVHRHMLPQEGDMKLASYLQELQDIHFEGALALDLYDYDYAAVAPNALAYLRSLLPAQA